MLILFFTALILLEIAYIIEGLFIDAIVMFFVLGLLALLII